MNIPKEIRKPILIPFAGSLLLVVISFVSAYVYLGGLHSLLIIHFNNQGGIDFLGSNKDVFGIISVATSVVIINLLMSFSFYFRNRYLAYLVSYSTVLFSALILIAVSVIISNN